MADPEARSPEAENLRKIRLRPVTQRDAPLLARWRGEDSVQEFQPLRPLTIGQLRAELARQRMADLFRGRGEKFQWIISVDSRPAGWITLVILNWDHGLAEIGYTLTSEYQHQGLMVPALRMLLLEIFDRTDLVRIEARCAAANHASQRVLEKAGFLREGRLRSYFRLHGQRVDNFLFALLKEDF